MFNNPFVTSKILEELKKINIQIYENYQMQAWNDGDWSTGEILTSVIFTGVDEEKPVEDLKLDCCVRSHLNLFYIFNIIKFF